MEILRVFNNNLVLALDEKGRDVILTGRGLGFPGKTGFGFFDLLADDVQQLFPDEVLH